MPPAAITHFRQYHVCVRGLTKELERQCRTLEAAGALDHARLESVLASLGNQEKSSCRTLAESIGKRLTEVLPRFTTDIYNLARDHREIDANIAAVGEALARLRHRADSRLRQKFLVAARRLIATEHAHIIAEEEILLPYAERCLNAEAWSSVSGALPPSACLAHDPEK